MTTRRMTILIAIASLFITMASGSLAQADEKAPIVGRELMTEQERDQYRTAMRALKTEEERAAMRKAHQKEMQTRARGQGIELPAQASPKHQGKRDGAGGPGDRARGRDFMTPEERAEQQERMRSTTSEEERKALRDENHEKVKERAHDRGVELPDKPMPHGGKGHRPGGRK